MGNSSFLSKMFFTLRRLALFAAKICLVSFWFLQHLLRLVKTEKQEGLVIFPLLLAVV